MRRPDKAEALMGHARSILRTVFWIATACICFALENPATAESMQPLNQQSLRAVRIGVFSLFRPKELVLRPVVGSSLTVELGSYHLTLPRDAPSLIVHEIDGEVQIRLTPESQPARGDSLRAHTLDSRAENSSRFWLEVPGKLRRQFLGNLEILAHGQTLEAVVTMPLDTAVASVVQAESPPGAGMEALKAQAVAARSFLVARQSAHSGFDFCDTTHCQFLRSPPDAASPAAEATRATEGLILTWRDEESAQDRPLAAMYARSCGGQTRTLSAIGAPGNPGYPNKGYPYYAVHCVYCSRHPEVWRREARSAARPDAGSDSTAEPRTEPRTERDRLNFNRIHGWGAIPSIAVKSSGSTDDAEGKWITGRGVGHGIGLCQLGAADMARHGASFAQILAHYYPNTRLASIPSP
jgi:stage II sporulation protein D